MSPDTYKGGFRELEAWRPLRTVRKQVIEDCKHFPEEESFLLTAQLKDASRSATANIDEGYITAAIFALKEMQYEKH